MLTTNVKELFFELLKNGVSRVVGLNYEKIDVIDSGATRIFWCNVFDQELMFLWIYCNTNSLLFCSTTFEICGVQYSFQLDNNGIKFNDKSHSYTYNFDQRPFLDFDGFDMHEEVCYELIQGFKKYIDGYFIK